MDVVAGCALGLSQMGIVWVRSHHFCPLRELLVSTVTVDADIHSHRLRRLSWAVASLAFDFCLCVLIDQKRRCGL